MENNYMISGSKIDELAIPKMTDSKEEFLKGNEKLNEMNLNGKSLKIKKIERYNNLIDEEKKRSIVSTVAMGISAASAAWCLINGANYDALSTQQLIAEGIGIVCMLYSSYELKNLIQSITKKTIYESKVEDLNEQLEISKVKVKVK